MKYREQDLYEFIDMLKLFKSSIQAKAKPDLINQDIMHSRILISGSSHIEHQKFAHLLFPSDDSKLLGLKQSDSSRKDIYDTINRELPDLDITEITIYKRDPFSLVIDTEKKNSKLPDPNIFTISRDDCKPFTISVKMTGKQGGKKKRYRKRRKSTKQKNYIKKKNYTKKRR